MSTLSPELQAALAILRQARTNLIMLGDSLSEEQLLQIPAGCNNNILWNLAHLPVTTCLLTRGLAQLELGLDPQFVAENRKGTSPADWSTPPAWSMVRGLLSQTVDWVSEDFAQQRHGDFQVYPTSFGFELAQPTRVDSR